MSFLVAVLRVGCLLYFISASVMGADVDDSTDLLLTFAQPIMNDTSPYPYHQSISAWYDSLLKVSLQRKAWPVDSYADERDFAPIFELLEAAYPNLSVNDVGDDQWAEPFIFKGQELAHTADALARNLSNDEAINYYM